MVKKEFIPLAKLNEGLTFISQSPLDNGEIKLIVCRPIENARKILSDATLTLKNGLEGDCWRSKPSSSSIDGGPHPNKQITIMNSRTIDLISPTKSWILAGDQFFADLNLSYSNIPPGTLLQLGTAIIKVSEEPHRGCKKFAQRFGEDAMRFVNSEAGRLLNLRGINTSVVQDGKVKQGDRIHKI